MILNIDGLSFRYGSIPVLQEVSFPVREGEILSLLGPNGAGKTTLLKCINRILKPLAGSVLIDGKEARSLSRVEIARQIGFVPQRGEVSRMKVYDLILLGRKPHFQWGPGTNDHALTEEAIQALGLDALALRYADEISGGEFQLVQIARALVQEPRAILLDEPTSNLDISNQYRLMAKIRTLIHTFPRAAVMTLHDINLAIRYSDQFILMKKGRIHAAGGREIITPSNIREVYEMDVLVEEVAGTPVVLPL